MFSGAVKLGDLDDYLSPAQDCVKPIIDAVKEGKLKTGEDDFKVEMRPKPAETIRPDLIKKTGDDTKAQVNLVDCLACSGCVTSADAVLLEQQGVPDFLQRVRSRPYSAVSISAQSCASLANHFEMSMDDVMLRLTTLFRRLGVKQVFDMSTADALALESAYIEFQDRVARHKAGEKHVLPMLTSHCPGWVVYAEKSIDESLLGHISRARPAQEIQGLLVKLGAVEAWNRKQWVRSVLGLGLAGGARRAVLGVRPGRDWLASMFEEEVKEDKGGCCGGGEGEKDGGCCGGNEETHDHADGDACGGGDGGCGGDCSSCPTGKEEEQVPKRDWVSAVEDIFNAPTSAQRVKVLAEQCMNTVRSRFVANRATDTWHVVLQPCFDKKLESVRPEFREGLSSALLNGAPVLSKEETVSGGDATQTTACSLVDGVLATSEVVALLQELNLDHLSQLPPTPFDALPFGPLLETLSQPMQPPTDLAPASIDGVVSALASKSKSCIQIPLAKHFSSGGFGSYILERARLDLGADATLPAEEWDAIMQGVTVRNKHMRELTVPVSVSSNSLGVSSLRALYATGFRNIQNVIKQLAALNPPSTSGKQPKGMKKPTSVPSQQPGASLFALVEVLACPSGCLNGGGQMHAAAPATDSGSAVALPKEAEKRLADLEMVLHSADKFEMHAEAASKIHAALMQAIQDAKDAALLDPSIGGLAPAAEVGPLTTALPPVLQLVFRSFKAKDGEITASQLKW